MRSPEVKTHHSKAVFRIASEPGWPLQRLGSYCRWSVDLLAVDSRPSVVGQRLFLRGFRKRKQSMNCRRNHHAE